MDTNVSWQPDWAVPPGEILLEALDERGMTQSELARRIDRPLKTVNEIVRGKAAITPDTAIQLERALGISARVWNGLETAYREYLAYERANRELEREAAWVDLFPIKDLVKQGLVRSGRTKAETLVALLSFFRVSSPSAWRRQWVEPSASFRSSPAFVASPQAVASWLRWGEIEADKVKCQPYDARRFREALSKVRILTRSEPFALVIERVRQLCAEAGVAIVLTPELKGTHLSGAARWLHSDKALLQLSLRHQSDDHFWFSLFHEAGHILEAVRRRDFVDSPEQAELDESQRLAEQVADKFAREWLVPGKPYDDFVTKGNFGSTAVQAFAKSLNVSPGIVVGRLQRDGVVAPGQLNHLKKPLRWNR